MLDTCVTCGREFENLGSHIWQTDCEYPDISDHKWDILTGLLMGDASLYRQAKTPYFQVRMINQEFLNYLDGKFSTLGRGVSLDRTAEETANMNKQSGFSPNTDKDNCSDLYLWRTMAHPEFNEFRDWYTNDGKVFLSDLDLAPTILKYWYISDGTLDTEYGNGITIAVWNEKYRPMYLRSLFDDTPVAVQRIDDRGGIHFSVEESRKMLDWIGKPLPGFEYKWEL